MACRYADSDEVARAFRDDVARYSDMMSPGVRCLAASTVALFEDFEEVVAGGGIERLKTPIIEDEQLHTAKRPQQACIPAIAAREREVGEQLWNALVEDGSIVATGFVPES